MKKLLVIFFLLCILLILIYSKYSHKKTNIFYIGDLYLLNNNDFDSLNNKYDFNTFLYDKITYKKLIQDIKNNNKRIIKEKDVYLTQLISKSDVIIINANNDEYNQKCKKNDRILKNYNDIISNNINDLINIIQKISHSKIVVIGNQCKNKFVKQKLNVKSEYIEYYNFNINSLNKIINEISN